MRKLVTFILVTTMLVTFAGCGSSTEETTLTAVNESSVVESTVTQESVIEESIILESTTQESVVQESAMQESIVEESIAPQEEPAKATHTFTQIKESPDKYTWYIKDYVGKNCATVGYSTYSGRRYDGYGAGALQLIFVTADGSYVDSELEDSLKEYVVTGQSLEPNTELKLVFEKDSEGNEYDGLVIHQSYKELVLTVKRVGTEEEYEGQVTTVNAAPDKYTWYISDYVGRNLADCGYVTYSGDIYDGYGAGAIRLVVVTDDGSFINPDDDGQVRGYKVVGQSIEPNTELKYTFLKDSDGVEYENLVDTQNIGEIDLYVSAIPNYTPSVPEEVAEENEDNGEGLVDGMHPEFKEVMDSYEEFFDEYVEFMNKFAEADEKDMLGMLSEYVEYMEQYTETMESLEEIDMEELTTEEALYYTEVMLRIEEKLLDVISL